VRDQAAFGYLASATQNLSYPQPPGVVPVDERDPVRGTELGELRVRAILVVRPDALEPRDGRGQTETSSFIMA
jgi:hypothetical protein